MLTTKQAAARLGISPRTVKDLCARGPLKCQKFGRDWLIDEAEVERYAQERRPRLGWPKGKARKERGI